VTAPRVKLHPDGHAVVETPGPIDCPWCAVWRNDDGILTVQVYSDDDAAGWPDYTPPA